MIPTGNKPSLIGYYCAFGAWLPIVGLPLMVLAIVFGVKGVALAKRHPEVRGGCHAWFAIVAGAGLGLIGLAATVGIIAAVVSDR
jgi:ABC-type transport system involved in cytochrome c biogenesis permease component